MARSLEEHRFNDDLLLDATDRQLAEQRFPKLLHVLDDPRLREFFGEFDKRATRAKLWSQVVGVCAVVLAVIGLCGASADRFYEQYRYVALGFSICGMLGVLIGLGGIVIWSTKKRWLYGRLLGERARQFHFQVFVCHAVDVLASLTGDDTRNIFCQSQQRWFAEFEGRFRNHAASEMTRLLEGGDDGDVWLYSKREVHDQVFAELPEEFFEAYRNLRIRTQIQYADYKLRHSQGFFAGLSPSQLEQLLGGASLFTTILVVLIEVGIGLLVARNALRIVPVLHVAAICSAIVALGFRTLEEGLQPKRELERYQRYHAETVDILNRFDRAATRRAKYEIMVEMERLSFVEMRDFLLANFQARFVM